MKETLIMTVCGEDGQETVKELLQFPVELKMEVAGSRVMRFAGMFSVVMKLHLKNGQGSSLATKITQRFPEMHFVFTPEKDGVSNCEEVCQMDLVVDGMAFPGVEKKIEGVLKQLDYQVESCEYSRCRVANISEIVLSARYRLLVPGRLSKQTVEDEVAALTEGMRVNVA